MSEYGLSGRLSSAASLVRVGARLADIGTDHAYLPITLLKCGKIKSAVCSDVNEGPLARAKENVEEAGLSSAVTLMLCPGAASLSGMAITDYAVCGMGGELIASIIEEAPHLRDGDIRLILQPMSKAEALRKYLWENGFSIDREVYSSDDGKYYVCLLAHFSGQREAYTDSELYFGKSVREAAESKEGRAYIEAKLSSLRRARDGKAKSGKTDSKEAQIVNKIEHLLVKG